MAVSGLRRKLLACFNSKADVASALPLPDDVIIDILSRLPADHVLQCRRVCKRWRALTSTAYFAQLQLQRATPVVLAGCLDSENPHCIFVNHASKRRNPDSEIAELNCRDQANYYQYFIANLPTFSRRPLSQGLIYCCPSSAEATLASGNLHWMLEHRKDIYGTHINALKMGKDDDPCANSILRFDIHTENLSTMPHPEWESCTGPSYGGMQHLQVDE
ncbi:hypothetical protein Tsubulata_039531, partial [Turnera subulata]